MRWFLLILGSVILLFLIYLEKTLGSIRYSDKIAQIDKKEYYFSQCFWIGFAMMELFSVQMNAIRAKQRLLKFVEIKGKKAAAEYNYAHTSAQLSYLTIILAAAFLIGAVVNDMLFVVFGLVVSVCVYGYLEHEVNRQVSNRREMILKDLPNVLSKLVLLVNAGLVLRKAWERVATNESGVLYKEMAEMTSEINQGTSAEQAINNFANRCAVIEVRKFASVVWQSMQKGSFECLHSLKELANENWEQKKTKAKRKGELASQKMLFPASLMFIGILLIIIVPLLTSLD